MAKFHVKIVKFQKSLVESHIHCLFHSARDWETPGKKSKWQKSNPFDLESISEKMPPNLPLLPMHSWFRFSAGEAIVVEMINVFQNAIPADNIRIKNSFQNTFPYFTEIVREPQPPSLLLLWLIRKFTPHSARFASINVSSLETHAHMNTHPQTYAYGEIHVLRWQIRLEIYFSKIELYFFLVLFGVVVVVVSDISCSGWSLPSSHPPSSHPPSSIRFSSFPKVLQVFV